MVEKMIKITVAVELDQYTPDPLEGYFNTTTLRLPYHLMELLNRKGSGLESIMKSRKQGSDGAYYPAMDGRSMKGQFPYARVLVNQLARDILYKLSEREEPEILSNMSGSFKRWRIPDLDEVRKACYWAVAAPELLVEGGT
jgi:hypothetical protein